MTRLPGWILLALALALAFAPVANDTCGLGCSVDEPPAPSAASGQASCPLHHEAAAHGMMPAHAPARCGHDHTTIRAATLQQGTAPETLTLLAHLIIGTRTGRAVLPHAVRPSVSPPDAPPRTTAPLRI